MNEKDRTETRINKLLI